MILNKKNFAVLVVLFLSSIPNSFASECYQINRKVCNFVLEPLGNNKERWQYYSDFYDCELNEQQYSDKMIKEYANANNKYSSSEIDVHIQQD